MGIGRTVTCLLAILATQTLSATALDRSVSPSQQFVIYGADALSRGAVSDLAEKTKANLLALLRSSDEWKTPIIINLQRTQANFPEIPALGLRFSQTGFGLKLQLALAPGRDRLPLIEALAVSNKIISLDEFLDQRPALLDSPARQLYRSYSFALVQLLTDQADGPKRLARYIGNLSHATNDSLADLRIQFPVLAGNDTDRIWKSNIVRLSKNYQLLAFAETERELDESLQTLGDEKCKGAAKLRELAQRKISRSEITALNRLSERLFF